MNRIFNIPTLSIAVSAQLFLINPATASAEDWSSWKNWYGIAWRDTAPNNFKYAKQMGYDYIGALNNYVRAGLGYTYYKNNPDSAGMKFYFIDPHTYFSVTDGYKRFISLTGTFTAEEIAFYNANMAWKSNDAFPNNMATGYPSGSTFSVVWDWQQQKVIDKVVNSIITMAHNYEAAITDAGYPFTFAGTIDDTGALTGEFAMNGVGQVSLAYWTGSDSSLVHSGITHEYATYSDGRAAYFKKLSQRMKEEFPNAKWIVEPSSIYHATWIEELIRHIKNRPDKDALTPDMIGQEGAKTDFVDDPNIYNSGVNITKDRVSIDQISQSAEYDNRLYAAKAGINGAWYNWFGNFGQTSGTPNFKTVAEVYPRLKLIRVIPGWDNLNQIPLASRTCTECAKVKLGNDASNHGFIIYESKNSNGNIQSHIDKDVMYSRHWKTGKLFAVFNSTDGIITLQSGETMLSAQRVDGFFMETGDGGADVDMVGSTIKLKSDFTIAVDTNNGQVMGNGYIFTLRPDTTLPTIAITSPTIASTYTTASAIIGLSGTASDNVGVASVAWSNSATGAGGATMGTTAWSITGVSLVSGSNTITVTAKDAANNTSTDTITVTYSAVGNPPVITSALSATGTVGTALSYQIMAANSPTSFNAAGLPAGLSVSTGGLISGTPTTIGTSSVTISAANSSGTGSAGLSLSVYSACDVNRDGTTNVVDVQLQVNAALGTAACASDLNRDGSCNVIDVQRVVNVGLGGQCLLGL